MMKEQKLKIALKRAKSDEDLSDELWDVRQGVTDIWQQFDGEVDGCC